MDERKLKLITALEAEKERLDKLGEDTYDHFITIDYLKTGSYGCDPKEALENMLATTNVVMLQYKNNPTSKAAKGVFDACIEHNKLFLIEVGIIDAD